MISTLLIANRGEIACRIIRTARAMNIRTVAVHSEADRGAMHVRMADAAVAIGPAPAARSYLDQEAILRAARETGADAVHPGYGFLSENAGFAEACEQAGLVFVGPPAAAIRAMGQKDEAKALMDRAGVPVVPGYYGPRQEPAFLKEKAYETGYPVLLKAVSGGGGKGMRRIDKAKDFLDALEAVKREAEGAFGDPRVLVEKFVADPRHIEIQIFADRHGNVVHLFERDCSAQRRHQKVIEEAPAPGMTAEVRAAMGEAAIEAARAVGYVGAGTVEFIAAGAGGLRRDGFWFMEMNTRLQVEHPVTEGITGTDLVAWQLRVADGERLPADQSELTIRGHAVEARVYAEDPAAGFLPSTGRLDLFRTSGGEGLRIDTGVEEGDVITPFYDPMIAKFIAHGPDRATALDRLSAALAGARIAGPATNVGFLKSLIDHPAVRAGGFDTGLIEREFSASPAPEPSGAALAAAVRALLARRTGEQNRDSLPGWRDPWNATTGFQLGGVREVGREVEVGGIPRVIRLTWDGSGLGVEGESASPSADAPGIEVILAGDAAYAFEDGRVWQVRLVDSLHKTAALDDAGAGIKAPMTGKLVTLAVAVGEAVDAGSPLFAVEAMKMEHAVTSATAGTVTAIHAEPGDQVEAGAVVVEVVAPDQD